jgi:hypothetical protein
MLNASAIGSCRRIQHTVCLATDESSVPRLTTLPTGQRNSNEAGCMSMQSASAYLVTANESTTRP